MEKENKNRGRKSKLGRKPKADPAIYRQDIRLNETENAKFETLFDLSGFKYRGHFIKDKVLNTPFKTIEIDKSLGDYIIKLSQFRGQIKGIGNNYNQLIKLLKEQLGERKALAYLFKLEKVTIEMIQLYKEIDLQTQALEKKWLQK